MGSSDVEISHVKVLFLFTYNGQGNEGYEGHGSHESHEGHEEEGCEQDCQGQACEAGGFQRHQGEDYVWLEEERFDQKQERQDCEQEAICQWQEGLRQHQGLDSCGPEGQESFGCQGLHRCEEGKCSLQEGQGALSVSIYEHLKATAQGVGMSTPFERRSFGY